uniref:C3H1-type domain-containing protein n=1 Tax=Timema shepardi TaxID=629360 RepID=A0A7R9G5J6_TIMSH|nr:unnamed protein product [Timema shepardi]
MIIEEPDKLKSWLAVVLEPMCDADPEALAKYIFALVKKDQPLNEMRQSMYEQLDVFLQNNTKGFVDKLIHALETQDYKFSELKTNSTSAMAITTSTPTSTTATFETSTDTSKVLSTEINLSVPLPSSIPSSTLQSKTSSHKTMAAFLSNLTPQLHTDTNTSAPPLPQSNSSNHTSEKLPSNSVKTHSHHHVSDGNNSVEQREDRNRYRRNHSPYGAARSRSRSWDRQRRSRSFDRRRGRDRTQAWRNKSPPSRRYNRERRRSWSHSVSPVDLVKSRTVSSRSKSRSPHYLHRDQYRARNHRTRSWSRSRSRSKSPSRSRSRSHSHSGPSSRSRERAHSKKEPTSGACTPTQDSNHGDVDMRLTMTSQSIQSVVSAGEGTSALKRTATPPAPGTFSSKRRCRDFDEKGYCMSGDVCPYDHGNDPVVVEDVSLSRVLALGPGSAPSTPAVTVPITVPPPRLPMNPVPHLRHAVPHHLRTPAPPSSEYNPDAPSMNIRMMMGQQQYHRPPMQGNMMGSRPMMYNSQPQRELINIPVVDQLRTYRSYRDTPAIASNSGTNTTYHPRPEGGTWEPWGGNQSNNVQRKRSFDYSRLGPKPRNLNNSSLELKKIPSLLNDITHLNNHFSKFGKIVNIQVCYEGDPEGAVVTFANHHEARNAYKSAEAVLNNRFIKVFWHNSANNDNNNNGNKIAGRLGSPYAENKPETLVPRPSVKERLGVPIPGDLRTSVQTNISEKPLEKVIMSGNTLTKTLYIPTALKKQNSAVTSSILNSRIQAAAAVKKSLEFRVVKETLKKRQEEKRKQAMKLTTDLRKRKQLLITRQLGEQKFLVKKLEQGVKGPQERAAILSTIKMLQDSVDKLRRELMAIVEVGSAAKERLQQQQVSEVVSKKSEPELANTLVLLSSTAEVGEIEPASDLVEDIFEDELIGDQIEFEDNIEGDEEDSQNDNDENLDGIGKVELEEVNPHLCGGKVENHLVKTTPVHPSKIRTLISPSSAIELNTTSALANYATEAVQPTEIRTSFSPSSAVELNTTSALANYATEAENVGEIEPGAVGETLQSKKRKVLRLNPKFDPERHNI